MAWRAEVMADDEQWHNNSLRFRDREEAEAYSRDLTARWSLVKRWRPVQDDEPVNAAWEGGRLRILRVSHEATKSEMY